MGSPLTAGDRPRILALLLCAVAVAAPAGVPAASIGSEEVAARLRAAPAYDTSPEGFRSAVEELQKQTPQLGPLLIEVLAGKDHLAARAATALGLLRYREAAEALADVLLDPPLPPRRVFETPPGSPQIPAGYDLHEVDVILRLREAAAVALGQLGGEAAIDALARFFSDGDLYAEQFLARERIVNPTTPERSSGLEGRLLARERSEDRATVRVLAPAEARALAAPLRDQVIAALAAADPVGAVELFGESLRSPDETVRVGAVRGLALCAKAAEARNLLVQLLLDETLPATVMPEVIGSVARLLPYEQMRAVVDALSDLERCRPREYGLLLLDLATAGGYDAARYSADKELRELLADRVKDACYNVAARAAVVTHRLGQDGPLLDALRERDLARVAEHFVFFIMLGQEGSEPLLREALESDGSAAMSDAFMLCGNAALLQAATAWREDSRRNERAEETAERSRSDLLFWGALETDDGR